MNPQVDFGYPWWLNYGHLVLMAVLLAIWILARALRWPKALRFLLAALGVWAFCGFLIARFLIDVNGPVPLPAPSFLAKGTGRVLDIGAGTGRSTIMVLKARPQVQVVALDLFGKSYEQHFGSPETGEQRLQSNLKAAGVENRASIQKGDMRELPFDTGSFEGIVSAYAVDHLSRDGIGKALGEAARVLKPGGEFLLMIIGKDPWLRLSFGPLLMHSTRPESWWVERLQEAGFQNVEHGKAPATFYYLAHKP